MWDSAGEKVFPYQWLLRAIGAYLDREAATYILIMEVPTGFAVRYQLDPQKPELQRQDFTFRELHEFKARMEASRTIHLFREERPGLYQDLLRAIGYEIEQAGAYSILIDQVEDDFVITYQYLDPTQGFVPHKRLSVVYANARGELLERARSRRGTIPDAPAGAPRKKRFSLLGRK
jgi:hypothetical protein